MQMSVRKCKCNITEIINDFQIFLKRWFDQRLRSKISIGIKFQLTMPMNMKRCFAAPWHGIEQGEIQQYRIGP
jgi:hypothetical protein